jgi:hypothetical protein
MAVRKFWVIAKMPGANQPTGRRDPIETALGRNGGQFARDDVIKTFYYAEADAITACEQLATANPLVPYAVLAISEIRETGTPTVLKKQFTDEGELIPV